MGCCDVEDEEIQNAQPTERKCTDVFWLILYILFWFVMVGVLPYLL